MDGALGAVVGHMECSARAGVDRRAQVETCRLQGTTTGASPGVTFPGLVLNHGADSSLDEHSTLINLVSHASLSFNHIFYLTQNHETPCARGRETEGGMERPSA